MKSVFILLFSLLFLQGAFAQDDIMKSLQDSTKKEYVTGAFKSTRVIMGQSVEFLGPGVLDLRIMHRFGRVNQGASQFFGLDQASFRLGFDYGITKNFTVGIGRSTTDKDFDGYLKYRLLQQSKGPGSFPISIVLVAGMSYQAYKNTDLTNKVSFNLRTGYYYQAVFGSKISSNFSLQVSPTMVHRNEVAQGDVNDVFAVGVGARYKFSKRMAFVVDYYYVTNGLPHSEGTNPLSVGIDIETGGHVFQLHFSNSSGLNERQFITETTNKWGKGEIQFGFNLSRVFNLKKHKAPAS